MCSDLLTAKYAADAILSNYDTSTCYKARCAKLCNQVKWLKLLHGILCNDFILYATLRVGRIFNLLLTLVYGG